MASCARVGYVMAEVIKIAGGTFDPGEHCYKGNSGAIVPSVTQIIENLGFVDFDNIPGSTLERKRQIGDSVHFACHLLDTCPRCQGILGQGDRCAKCNAVFDEGSLDWESVDIECANFIMAYQSFKTTGDFIPEGSEESGIGTLGGMPFGYTRDRHGRMRGIKYRIVLELKCAYAEEESWKWQLAPYATTVPRTVENEFIARIALQLKPDATFKLYPYEDPRDLDVFRSMLYLTHVKINAGLKWQKPKL